MADGGGGCGGGGGGGGGGGTPGFTRPLRARGAPHPGHHSHGRGPGCGDHSDAPGGPDLPPCAGYFLGYMAGEEVDFGHHASTPEAMPVGSLVRSRTGTRRGLLAPAPEACAMRARACA